MDPLCVPQAIFICLVAAAAAAPQQNQQNYYQQPQIKLVSYRFNMDNKGNYEYGYQQDNGQKVGELIV